MKKYIFFDCYGGFDLQMAFSALADMTDDADAIQAILSKLWPEITFIHQRTGRRGMDALLAYIDFYPDEEIPVFEIIDKLKVDDDIRAKLGLWYKIQHDGMAENYVEDVRELLYAAAILIIIKGTGADNIYISEIHQGNALGVKDGSLEMVPSHHTELVCKMAKLRINSINADKEILTASAAALLYALEAEYMAPKAHNVSKSGYGASEIELDDTANIARCLLAPDDDSEYAGDLKSILAELDNRYSDYAGVQ